MKNTRLALFIVLFASYAYFYQAGGANQNSRFGLVRAITYEHSVRIDSFQAYTGDKAFFGGHYYSDKAPGLAFAAVPVVAAARRIVMAFRVDPGSPAGITLLSYLATVFTVGLPTALAGVCLFNLSLTFGATPGGALLAALVFGVATPMWALATLFWGHALAASCLVFAFAAATRIGSLSDCRQEVRLGVMIGVGAGWATVSEFPAAVPALCLALLSAAKAWPLGHPRSTRILSGLVVGAVACIAVLGAYQYLCFGSPFHVGYMSEQGFDAMKQGTFGIHAPQVTRLRAILFGSYRGLLPLAPALAIAPVGFALFLARSPRAFLDMCVASLIVAYYLLMNAGYAYWDGGWSYGPRHISPAIPFLCLGLGIVWTAVGRIGRSMLVVLSAWGTALSLVAVSTMPQVPSSFSRPVAELLWPAFYEGDLSLNTQSFATGGADPDALRAHTEPKAAWNVGMKMGLTGHASLAPLVIVWIAGAMWFSASETRRGGFGSRAGRAWRHVRRRRQRVGSRASARQIQLL